MWVHLNLYKTGVLWNPRLQQRKLAHLTITTLCFSYFSCYSLFTFMKTFKIYLRKSGGDAPQPPLWLLWHWNVRIKGAITNRCHSYNKFKPETNMAERPLSLSDKSSTKSSHSVQRVPNNCLSPQTGKGNIIFTGMICH